jgi:hypothetical protein
MAIAGGVPTGVGVGVAVAIGVAEGVGVAALGETVAPTTMVGAKEGSGVGMIVALRVG